MRKEQFKRPDPGFSLYEGRTRGKKMKYTYSDDEDVFDSESTNRRSTRNTRAHTPADAGPVTTSSGRQIRAPTRLNPGSSAPGSVEGGTPEFEKESSTGLTGRPRRSGAVNYGTNGWAETGRSRRNTDDSEDESEAEFGDDEDDADAHVPEESEDEDDFDEEEAMVEDDLDDRPRSLVVKLSVTPPKLRNILSTNTQAGNILTPSSHRTKNEKLDTPEAPLVEMPDAPNVESSINGMPNSALATSSSKDAAGQHLLSPQREVNVADRQPPTPATIHVTPLAFRGSPEKSHVQPLPRPLDISTQQ